MRQAASVPIALLLDSKATLSPMPLDSPGTLRGRAKPLQEEGEVTSDPVHGR
jgi:hypothetical protein